MSKSKAPAGHQSMIPIINIAPFNGFRMHQCISQEELKQQIAVRDAEISIRREVYLAGDLTHSADVMLKLRDGEWLNPQDIYFEMDSVGDVDAISNASETGYVETHFTCDEPVFTTLYPPSFYTVFDAPGRKAFYSDGALKFANPYVIDQVHKFGEWSETYPACEIDPGRDVTMSAILINPYPLPTLVRLQLVGGSKIFRHQLPALGALRINLKEQLSEKAGAWSGTLLAWSTNRVVVFVVSHSIADPTRVTTVEHSEVYRAAEMCQPLYDKVLSRVQRYLRRATPVSNRAIHRKVPRVSPPA